MESKVVPESVDGSGRCDAPAGQVEAHAEGVAQAFGGGLEHQMEEMAAFAEDAAQDFGDGEDELAVRPGVADAGGDPFAGLAGAALVTGGQKCRDLQVKARSFSWPQSGQW